MRRRTEVDIKIHWRWRADLLRSDHLWFDAQHFGNASAVGRIRHGAVGDMPLLDMPGGLIHLAGRVIEQRLLLLRIHLAE
jgi:hypothetical protein